MEFYVETNSFAAPFFSDSGQRYVEAATPREALEITAREYTHPCGLYAAACYSSADRKNKGEKPLARWLSNHARRLAELTEGLGSYSCRGNGPGEFEINGEKHTVKDPKGGSIVEEE